MKKDGFTLVELLVSIVIISLVLSFLLNMLIQLKSFNSTGRNNTALAITQALVTKEINGDIYKNGGINSVSLINNKELTFKVNSKDAEVNRKIIIDASGYVKYYKGDEMLFSEKPENDMYDQITYNYNTTTKIHKIVLILKNALNTEYNSEIYCTDY